MINRGEGERFHGIQDEAMVREFLFFHGYPSYYLLHWAHFQATDHHR
jgi:hypothetical protein